MKKLLLKLLLFVTIFACTKKEETTEKRITNPISNEALIKEYFEYFNTHQWSKMAEMYSDTAEFKDPSLGVGIVKQTRQQTRQKYAELHKVFSDINDKVVAIYPSSEKHIIVEFVSSGTAPDGSKFELPICTIFMIENNKITKDFTYFDNFQE